MNEQEHAHQPITNDTAPQRLYRESTWKGLPQWRCLVCGWDTLKSEQEMIEHVRAMHLPREKREVVETGLVDRFGNPIRREVVAVQDAPLPAGEEVEDGETEPHGADRVGDED